MRSAVTFLSVCGAVASVAPACENDVDSQALLQSKKVVRQHHQATSADDLLHSMQRVASSLNKDHSVTMTPEEVNAAIGQASTSLETMFPMISQQHDLAEDEIGLALGAIESCHHQHGGERRANIEQRVAANFAAIGECEDSLGDAGEEQERACEGQGVHANCECTEARQAVTDLTALCAAETGRYEAVFCSGQLFCNFLHECHAQEVSVYQALMNDLQAEMISRQQQYVTLQQTNCIMALITSAMLAGTPIDHNRLTGCSDNIDLTGLTLAFPDPPSDPRHCHSPEAGDPQCEDFYGQTVDGCPRDNTNPNAAGRGGSTSEELIPTLAHTSSAHTASVRCCSTDGNSCATSDLGNGCEEGKTLVEAEAICAANDMRLCTELEMADNVCCNTGCWFNHHAVWVTPSALGSNPQADTKCPHNNDDRLFREPNSGTSTITRAACFAQCQATEGCNHYSWGEFNAGHVCMGCTSLDNAQHHARFTAYDM